MTRSGWRPAASCSSHEAARFAPARVFPCAVWRRPAASRAGWEAPRASPRRASARRSTLAAVARTSAVDAVMTLERAEEGDVRSRRLATRSAGRFPGATPLPLRWARGPGAMRAISRNAISRWNDSWTVAPPQGGLPRMDTLQHERLREVRAVGGSSSRRPEVVVLALDDRPGRNEGRGRRAARGRRAPSDGRTARRRVRATEPQCVRPGCGAASPGRPSPSRSRMPPPTTPTAGAVAILLDLRLESSRAARRRPSRGARRSARTPGRGPG